MTNNADPKIVNIEQARKERAVAVGKFAALSLPEKVEALRTLPAKKQLDRILDDQAPRELTRAIPEHEFFFLVKEVGSPDAAALWELASPEQRTFILDLELWDKWTFSPAKAFQWLDHLLEAGEETVVEQLPHLDLELLILMLQHEIIVGGGIGDLVSDEERTADYDHSFDNVYFITFLNAKHARAISAFLDIVFRIDRELYLGLMEGVKGELESEVEELAYRFRSGRLADLGLPELEDALALYARVDPASFAVAGDKRHTGGSSSTNRLPSLGGVDSLFQRTLARAGSEEIDQELTYLMNRALVADGTALHDREVMEGVFQRVHGYLNIALEHLTGGDEEEAAHILRTEYLHRLFQLGFSIVMELHAAAEGVTSDDYAAGKLLRGLRTAPPQFYRALDADGVDGYREFREITDVCAVREMIARLRG